MATVLYRKYRPQKFGEVTNQNHIKVTLQNEIETGRLAHAYLFCGPRGIGKTTIARIFAKAINCEKRKEGQSEPCDECPSCEEIAKGRAMDIIEIDAASHTGVENVRENIIGNAKFIPSRRKYKVFIIDEVHMLSTPAFNALLKIMEEPPAHVVFILATTELYKLPATVVSRCQRFDFKKINSGEIVNRLNFILSQEGIEVEDGILEDIARHSEGCVRDAESALGKILSFFVAGEKKPKKITKEQAALVLPHSDFDLVQELVGYLVIKDATRALNLVNELVENGVDLSRYTGDVIEFLRKIMLLKISGKLSEFSLELNDELEKEVKKISDSLSLEDLIYMIELFISKEQELKYSEIIQLPLELAVVEICNKEGLRGQERAGEGNRSGGSYDIKPTVKQVKVETVEKPKIKTESKEKTEAAVNTPSTSAKATADKGKIEIPTFKVAPFVRLEKTVEAAPVESEPEVRVKAVSGTTPPSPEAMAGKAVITLGEVNDKWEDILKETHTYNHSLPLMLKVCRPFDVDGNVLKLGFRFKFHKERMEERKNLDIMEKVLKQVLGKDIIVTAILADIKLADLDAPIVRKEEPVASEGVQNVLAAFGGKLVE